MVSPRRVSREDCLNADLVSIGRDVAEIERLKISGPASAVIRRTGAVDLPKLREILQWHEAEGTAGVVILGTTMCRYKCTYV